MKIGIYGGTFDPIHNGHLITAECVRDSLTLDRIIFVPSYISPHKQEGEEKSVLHRVAMASIAVSQNEHFEISDYETKRNETSFTIDTLTHLRKVYSDDSFYVIVGMDNYITFHMWKEPKKIIELASLVVMNRPNYPMRMNEITGSKGVLFVDVPNIDISSSEIRQKVKENKSVKYLIPDRVEEYIKSNELYK